jgi:hypothetical protein
MRINRRQSLKSMGAALLCAPFYRLLSEPARARAAIAPKRIIFWFSPNGTVHKHWRPVAGADEKSFSFGAGSILEPLAAHRESLIILDGLDFVGTRGGSHEGGMEHALTGGGGPSLDQFMAAQLGMATAFPSIELGVQTSAWGASIQTRMSYNDKHQFVHPEDDPSAAYRRLFGGAAAPMQGASTGQVGAAPADPRKSVLDVVRGELNALKKQLGTDEQIKLDAHLDSLRQIERRTAGAAAAGGASCGGMQAPKIADPKNNEQFPEVGKLQMDILVAAAACDLSRVLSLQWTHTVSPTIFSWAGASEGHHELSHKDDGNQAGVAAFVQAERWVSEQFAAFLERLKATPEADGSGTLLDTSTVVWVKELGDGRLHDFKSVPFIIAGGGNGYWNLGRYLKLDQVPHQKLLVALGQSMGIALESFGVDNVTGALGGLAR